MKFSDCKYVFVYQLRNYWKPAPLQEETLLQALPAKSRVEKWDAVFLTINLRRIFKPIITAMVEKPYQLGDLQNLYIAQTLYTKKILRGRGKHLSDKNIVSCRKEFWCSPWLLWLEPKLFCELFAGDAALHNSSVQSTDHKKKALKYHN